MLVYNDQELLETAEVVTRINPSCSGMTPCDLVAHMKRNAEAVLADGKNSRLSIYGYVLSTYPVEDGNFEVRASVHTYTVKKWLETRR